MKDKIIFTAVLSSVAALCGCVGVDSDVASRPSVYWKAPKDAMPENYVAPEQIKTDKIETPAESSDKQKPAKAKTEGPKDLTAAEKFEAGAELDLPDIVDLALENNTTTRIYWFQAKQYAAAKGKANSAYYPQLTVGGQLYRAKNKPSYGITGLPVGSYYETGYGPSAQINWLIYDFGKREAQVESARDALRAANFEYNQSIQDVVFNVNVAYYNYYAAVGSVNAAEQSLQDCKVAFDSADKKLKAGVGNRQDMLNALASLKNAEYVVESKRADVETARANLANAVGVRVSSLTKISESVKIPTSPESERKIDELIGEAMKGRQSLMASYAVLSKTRRDIAIAERAYLPQIGAQAAANYVVYSQSSRNDAYEYQVGLTASWDIFDGFNRRYDLISAKAKERAQAQQLKSDQIVIISDVWASYHLYRSALKQVASADAAVKAGEEAYQATRTGFESGVSTITDLLNAQASLATARQTSVSANAVLSNSIARLSHAVGALGSKIPLED